MLKKICVLIFFVLFLADCVGCTYQSDGPAVAENGSTENSDVTSNNHNTTIEIEDTSKPSVSKSLQATPILLPYRPSSVSCVLIPSVWNI